MNVLVAYLVGTMLAWSPVPRYAADESPEQMHARYEGIARDLAAVALDSSEPPVYAGDDGRARTALLLTSIAFWESGLRKDIDEGHCRPGDCDHGVAVSVFQLHAEQGGLVLDGLGFTYAGAKTPAWRRAHAERILHRSDLAQDRRTAARVALHMLRRSIRVWTQGERARLHANAWWASHPFPEPIGASPGDAG